MTSSSAAAAASTSARQKQRGSSLPSVPIMPESRHRPAPPRNRWSVTPSSAQAADSSPMRYSPSRAPSPSARYASDGGMTSPSSPSVQVTSVTCAPSAAYLAIVAPVPIDSSSGCACTSSSRLAELMRASLPAAARSAGTGKMLHMTESFPRQEARTRRFTLGVPRAFRISPDGTRVAFLRTQGGGDPVTCLWMLDVGSGTERLVADPRMLGGDEADLPPEERARRERVREQAGGIVAYATDTGLTVAVFPWSGRVYAVDLTRPGAVAHEVAVPGPALDPRPDPAGKRLAYVRAGALRVASLSDPADDQVLAAGRGRDVRAGGVHRGRGDGPDPRLLVVPGRLGAAGGAGGRDAGEPVAHRRPGQPGPGARRGGLSGGRHPERRGVRAAGQAGRQHRGGGHRPRRVPLPGDGLLDGRARPAGGGAEPGPADDAAAVRRRRDRPGRGAARGHRPGAGWRSSLASRPGPRTAGWCGPPTGRTPAGC